MRHIPVLLKEITEGLAPEKGGVYIDCNLGDGGHAEAMIELLKGDVTVLGFDIDPEAIERARTNIETAVAKKGIAFDAAKKLLLFRKNFRTLGKTLEDAGLLLDGYADSILFDLGLSSYEIDESGRGFSFQRDEPLSMTFGKKRIEENGAEKPEGGSKEAGDPAFDAYDILNGWEEEDIANVIFAYGEDRYARRIAKRIVEEREVGEIKSTKQLADIVKRAYPAPARLGKIHPATRTFQAIRIAVNDELRAIEDALPQALKALKQGGRLGVISFHSLEDRIVKNFFKKAAEKGSGKIITKRPLTAGDDEKKRNPRSRSAKLRIIEKL